MTAVPPDYDSDPERRRSWTAPQDVHEIVAPELYGPILDIGCGEGRLARRLADGVAWFGVDSSPAQVAAVPYRPVVLADMQALPFRDGAFSEVTHLWCLYHLSDPVVAIAEAERVLRAGGRYYASTAARDAATPSSCPRAIPTRRSTRRTPSRSSPRCSTNRSRSVGTTSSSHWNARRGARVLPAATTSRPNAPEAAALPLWLTKRGVLVRATKSATIRPASRRDAPEDRAGR